MDKKNPEQEKHKNLCAELIKVNEIRIIKENEIKIEKKNSTKLGEGGQASVYFGLLDNKHEVAVKDLKVVDWKNLSNELIIISNTEHENIPKFHGLILTDNTKIEMVFDYISGQTLDQFKLNNFNFFSEEDKINITKQIYSAMKAIYNNKFIHRDLKPENIMIDKNKKAYIIDFGIGKVLLQSDEVATRAKGSIYYTAPETLIEVGDDENSDMFISLITHKVDVWAFGCIISYLFSGCLPWTNKYADSEKVIYDKLVAKKPFPIPDKKISNEKIKKIIKIATEVDPKKRATIEEIDEILSTI